jgi:flagellar FliL protein
MAKEQLDQEEQQEKKGGNRGLMILLSVIVLLLVIGIGLLAFMLMKGGAQANGQSGTEALTQQVEVDENGVAQEAKPEYKPFDPPPPNAPPQYFIMDKLVVNFNGDGQAKYLAVDLNFMSYYPKLVGESGEMEHLRPILKDRIQRLLRNQHYNDLNTATGPDKLKEEVLAVAREILEKHNINPELLEDVFMTRFVMQ